MGYPVVTFSPWPSLSWLLAPGLGPCSSPVGTQQLSSWAGCCCLPLHAGCSPRHYVVAHCSFERSLEVPCWALCLGAFFPAWRFPGVGRQVGTGRGVLVLWLRLLGRLGLCCLLSLGYLVAHRDVVWLNVSPLVCLLLPGALLLGVPLACVPDVVLVVLTVVS